MPNSDEYEYEEEDTTSVDEVEVDETEEDGSPEEEAASGNPALNELYDILPKSLHGMIQPVVDKWQAGIDQQFEKIAPYRKFADSGVNADIIEASLQLATEISNNPRAVYDELAERYGWKQAEAMMETALKTANAATEKTDDLFYAEDPDTEVDPTVKELEALKAEIEALRGEREEEKAQATEAEYEYQIEQSLEILKNDHGDFDEEMIVRRAMLLAEDYPNAELPQLIGAAFEQYQAEVEKIRGQVKRAPKVAGGTGNSIPAPAPVKLNTREDRVAAIENIIKNSLG